MSHQLADRWPLVKWRSRTNRICVLTVAGDGTPEAFYEPRSAVEIPAGCETFALEEGMLALRNELACARLAIIALEAERLAVSRAIRGQEIDDPAVTEASHAAADALTKFKRIYGGGRPWTEDLVGAAERRG